MGKTFSSKQRTGIVLEALPAFALKFCPHVKSANGDLFPCEFVIKLLIVTAIYLLKIVFSLSGFPVDLNKKVTSSEAFSNDWPVSALSSVNQMVHWHMKTSINETEDSLSWTVAEISPWYQWTSETGLQQNHDEHACSESSSLNISEMLFYFGYLIPFQAFHTFLSILFEHCRIISRHITSFSNILIVTISHALINKKATLVGDVALKNSSLFGNPILNSLRRKWGFRRLLLSLKFCG